MLLSSAGASSSLDSGSRLIKEVGVTPVTPMRKEGLLQVKDLDLPKSCGGLE